MKGHNLHNVKSTGYKVPEGYFESLDNVIFSKISEDTVQSKVTNTGFEVPHGYFDSLEQAILESVKEDQDTNVISLINWKKIVYISGIAACVLIVFNLLFSNSNDLTFSDIDTASIENYLENEDVNAYDIAPYLNTSEINSADFVENSINASEIEDYLLQNSDVEYLISD